MKRNWQVIIFVFLLIPFLIYGYHWLQLYFSYKKANKKHFVEWYNTDYFLSEIKGEIKYLKKNNKSQLVLGIYEDGKRVTFNLCQTKDINPEDLFAVGDSIIKRSNTEKSKLKKPNDQTIELKLPFCGLDYLSD